MRPREPAEVGRTAISPRSWRSWVVLLALLAATPVVGFGLLLVAGSVAPAYQSRANRVPFDPARWQAGGPAERYDMSWDLLHRGTLAGMTPGQVEALLGQPTGSETLAASQLPMFAAGHAPPGTLIWYYDLGPEKYEWQIGPSGAILAVDFAGGKVNRVRKVVH